MPLPLPAHARRHSTFNQASSPGTVDGFESDCKAVLVDRIKALQRSSSDAKQSWWRYCSQQGKADFDPNRHDAAFLQGFMSFWETGQLEYRKDCAEKGLEDKASLIVKIKEVQRSSAHNKETWYTFCQQQGTSNYDPQRHDEKFLRRYLEAQEAGRLGGTPSGSSFNSSSSASTGKGGKDWSQNVPCGDAFAADGVWDGKGGKGCDSWDAWSKDGWSGAQGDWGMSPWMMGKGMMGKDMSQGMGMMGMGMNMDPYGTGMMGKGKDMFGKDMSGKGMMGMDMFGKGKGYVQQAPDPDVAWKKQGFTTMNMNKSKSEFGILAAPPASLVNRKRGPGSVSAALASPVAPGAAGGLMTEEQAKEFQKLLKRGRT